MKRILFSLLGVMVAMGMSAHHFAEVNADGDTIYYNRVSDAKYGKAAVEVTYKGSWYRAFTDNYKDTIVIPNTVKHGDTTFTVVGIGEQAFSICHELTSITIADSIKYIRNEAFKECRKLAQINYNAVHCADLSMQEYAPFSFANMYWGWYEYPEGRTDYPDYYHQEYAMKELNIGAQVEHIPAFMFYGMAGAAGVADYRQRTTVVKDSINGIESINFLGVPKTIGDQAFRHNMKLYSVTIPAGVEKMGDAAFADCDTLTKVVINANLDKVPQYCFMNCYKLEDLTLPSSIKGISYKAFANCDSLIKMDLPLGVTTIGPSAFAGCDKLARVNLDKLTGLTTIDGYAFSQCLVLDSVKLYNQGTGVTIGNYAYEDCTNLSYVDLKGAKQIGDYVFSGCRNLKTTVVPKTFLAIRQNTFRYVDDTMEVLTEDDESRSEYAADPHWKRFFKSPAGVEQVSKKKETDTNRSYKTVRDGQIVIQKGDRTFNLLGQEIK